MANLADLHNLAVYRIETANRFHFAHYLVQAATPDVAIEMLEPLMEDCAAQDRAAAEGSDDEDADNAEDYEYRICDLEHIDEETMADSKAYTTSSRNYSWVTCDDLAAGPVLLDSGGNG